MLKNFQRSDKKYTRSGKGGAGSVKLLALKEEF